MRKDTCKILNLDLVILISVQFLEFCLSLHFLEYNKLDPQ